MALFGRTTTLNVAICCASFSSIPAGQRRKEQVAGAAAVDLYDLMINLPPTRGER
jgi:hypothetical protein